MSVIEKAVEWAINIANDDSHGYDQIGRWGPDFDCSSLVISAFEEAGVKVKEAGATYTGNMLSAFKKCGFEAIPYEKGMTLKRGDVLLNKKHHTVLYIGDGKIVQASINEKGGIYNGKDGDQTGKEIAVGNFYEYSKGWDYVLRYPEDDNKQEDETVEINMPTLREGDCRPEVGTLQAVLNGRGFKNKLGKSLTIDCQFGPNTAYALGLAQRSFGLKDDKICGAKTWPALLKSNY